MEQTIKAKWKSVKKYLKVSKKCKRVTKSYNIEINKLVENPGITFVTKTYIIDKYFRVTC